MTYLSQNLSSERLVLESWGKDQSYSYLILHNKIEKLKFYSLSKPYRSERVNTASFNENTLNNQFISH